MKILAGRPITDADTELGVWVRQYIDTCCKGYVRPSTLANYYGYEKHIASHPIAKIKLNKLNTAHVQAFLNDLNGLRDGKSLKAHTVRNIWIFLSGCLAYAENCGLVWRNAAKGCKLKKADAEKRPFLSDDDVNKLIHGVPYNTRGFIIELSKNNTETISEAEVYKNGIAVYSVTTLICKGVIEAFRIEYGWGQRRRMTYVQYKDFVGLNLSSYFPPLNLLLDYPQKRLNRILLGLILSANESGIVEIPDKSGWYYNGKRMIFVTDTQFEGFPEAYISEGVRSRQLIRAQRLQNDVIYNCIGAICDVFELKLLLAFRFSSLLLYFFAINGIDIQQAIVLELSDEVSPELLIALLKTNETATTVTQSLNAPKTKILKELENVNDGCVVIRDTGYIEDTKSRKAALACVVEDLLHANGVENYSRHLITIISRNAGRELPPEHVCRVSFNNVQTNLNGGLVQRVCREVEYTLVQYMMTHADEVKKLITQVIKIRDSVKNVPRNRVDMFALLMSFSQVYTRAVGKSFWKEQDTDEIKSWLSKRNEYLDIAQEVVRDFKRVVNDCIRQGTFHLVEKRMTEFQQGNNDVIVSEHLLSFETETIRNEVLPRLSTTSNIRTVIDALDECDALYKTKKKHHPIDVYTNEGESVTIYAYSIFQSVLDYENMHKIKNLKCEEFFLAPKEVPGKELIPILMDSEERLAGVRFNRFEDGHVFVTGQSGYGKTTLLARIAAARAHMGHRVVIFDFSGSFSPKELEHLFPKGYIKEYIEIYNLNDYGIPVDLFSLEGCESLPEKKNALAGILSAATDELNTKQIRKLKRALSTLIKNTAEIDHKEIMDMLDELGGDDVTYACLLSRLEPVLEDIEAYGMQKQGWEQFFSSSKDITIISSKTSFAPKDTPLADMLIASLYNYQMLSNHVPLAIVVDEIQDQNFSAESPNYQILAKSRKNGISFIGATLHYRNKGNRYGEAMSNADIRVFLKPTPGSIGIVATELGYTNEEIAHLKEMKIYDCIARCNFYSKKENENIPATISGRIPKKSVVPATKGYQRYGTVPDVWDED